MIVAFDEDRGIGRGGSIPWNIPEDRHFFRKTTTWGGPPENVLVVGSKTAATLPPLDGRTVITVSRQSGPSLEETLRDLQQSSEHGRIWVIGGGEIYRECLEKDLVSYVYVTHIPGRHGCDTFFPEFEDRFRCLYKGSLTETVQRSVWVR